MILMVTAIFIGLLAHLIRVYRWQLFIAVYEKPNTSNLLRSLSVAYFFNYILPFKLGDLVRVYIAGRKMKNGKSLGFSSVICDRYLDIIAMGLLFTVFSITKILGEGTFKTTKFYIFFAIAFLSLFIIIFIFRRISKKVIHFVASIFNEKIELAILKFFWTLIWNFKDIFVKISKVKLFISTMLMWTLYILSYYFVAEFATTHGIYSTWQDVFLLLFSSNNLQSRSYEIVSNDGNFSIWLSMYLILPSALMFLLSFVFFRKREKLSETTNDTKYFNLLPHINPKDRLDFLEIYFLNKNRDFVTNYLRVNQDVLVLRDYSAGSNATTILCTDGSENFFRKYAFGASGKKLRLQLEWLIQFAEVLPLPKILRHSAEKKEFCFYDMPYSAENTGLFDYAHSMPKENTWQIIENAFLSLENSIYKMNASAAESAVVKKYIAEKVQRNIDKIINSKYVRQLYKYSDIYINGRCYKNISHYTKILSPEFLYEVFKNDTCANIHGDMTIENIISVRAGGTQDSFYIIDPNTGNILDTPNLDYAKMLQSLHGGYEFLMATKNVEVEENHINFVFIKSQIYTYLYERFHDYMQKNFSLEKIRSIYFHEIVHWIRLLPYKIEKLEKLSLVFYAGLLMVLEDTTNKFGAEL